MLHDESVPLPDSLLIHLRELPIINYFYNYYYSAEPYQAHTPSESFYPIQSQIIHANFFLLLPFFIFPFFFHELTTFHLGLHHLVRLIAVGAELQIFKDRGNSVRAGRA